MTERLGFLLYFLLSSVWVVAQGNPKDTISVSDEATPYCQWITTSNPVFLDSLSLVPNSIHVVGEADSLMLSPDSFHYDYNTGFITFHNDSSGVTLLPDSVKVCYRTLRFSLHARVSHKNLDLYDSTALFNSIRFKQNKTLPNGTGLERDELFTTPNLSKSGSLSRGISFGNRQDVFVNADLNLQLEGALTDQLHIRAAISDQNIPVQPEGNTQQIQNFDKVFLELSHQKFSLMAGDVLLQPSGMGPDGKQTGIHKPIIPYFLQYRRNVKGALLKTNYAIGEGGKAETGMGVALAKGKFASVTLTVREGVLGPYRLSVQGENQRGISNAGLSQAYYVLASSEKVYLDGVVLSRGFDNDYVIDYNLGEITFTNLVLITRYSRVSVDFEYADRNFSRSILTASHRQTHGKASFYLNFYQEKDNPNQPLGFDLSDEDKLRLSLLGEDVSEAYVSSADSVASVSSQLPTTTLQEGLVGVGTLHSVYYDKIDTVVDNRPFTIYQITSKTEGVFRVTFTEVGAGKGDYQLSSNTINGKSYIWIAPSAGKSKGNYAPVKLLNTPKSNQMVTLGTEVAVTEKDKITGEIAFSKQDLNLYANETGNHNQGKGIRIGYHSTDRKLNFKQQYTWHSSAVYEFRQHTFQEIDPYRNIEFERNWATHLTGWAIEPIHFSDDHILQVKTMLEQDADNRIAYVFTGRNRGSALKGQQQTVEVAHAFKKIKVRSDLFLLNTRQQTYQANWRRLSVDARWQNKVLVPGYTYRFDRNTISTLHSDSIQFSANYFDEHQFYLHSGDSLSTGMRLDYSIRNNQMPVLGTIKSQDKSRTLNGSINTKLWNDQEVALRLTYRKTNYENDSAATATIHENGKEGSEEILMGGLDWAGSFFNNLIRADLKYSLANGRELKREFVYVKVPTGEGTFTWRDDNHNGIEELQEFYEAIYADECDYARIFLPTNDFVLAYATIFNYRLTIQPPLSWMNRSGPQKFLGRFSNHTAWTIERKVNDENIWKRMIPTTSVAEDQLLSIREAFQSTLLYNIRNTQFGMDASVKINRRKQLLNVGFDERAIKKYEVNARYAVKKELNMKMGLEKNIIRSALDFLGQPADQQSGKNYLITSYKLGPELGWQPGFNFRLTGRYALTGKEGENGSPGENSNLLSEKMLGNKAIFNLYGCDLKLNRLRQNSLTATLEYISIDYQGEEKTSYAYEILEGLRPGNNARWSVMWQQKIMTGLQLSLQYQGRKSPEQAIIHSGSMQIRALF